MSHSCQILSIYPDCYGLNLSYVFLISKIIILEKKEKGKKAICCPFPLITMNGTILTTTTPTTTTPSTVRKKSPKLVLLLQRLQEKQKTCTL